MITDEHFNIAGYLPEMAEKHPDMDAIVFPKKKKKGGKREYVTLSYSKLNEECDRFATGLSDAGLEMGMKVLLMVKPSIEFIALTFALFKMGTVPILIDPGMGRKRLLECIRDVAPDAVIGIPLVHIIRLLFRGSFKTSRVNIVVGPSLPFLGKSLYEISPAVSGPFKIAPIKIAPTTRKSEAAILFTTGSTGPAKGVLYEHGMFDAQVQILKSLYNFQPGEKDLPGLPVFALFDVALGMTCVIPDMDPTRPAEVDPANIVEAVEDHGVTTSFGSPAIWKQVAAYCLHKNITLPSVKRILMAGAPVPGKLIEELKRIIPNGDVHTPYGATESLPVSSISGAEILNGPARANGEGKGTCVGKTAPGIKMKIIKSTDDVIDKWDESLVLPDGETGEIAVKGNVVTNIYYGNKEATEKAKIREGDEFWHRIGDMGYFDDQGRLWFCGRKTHRVMSHEGPLDTIPFEGVFNRHDRVTRTALVGVEENGSTVPTIIVEPIDGCFPESRKDVDKFKEELTEIGAAFPHTAKIKDFLFHRRFPVDIRHNAKIFREKLTVWAREVKR